jgi:predicted GTPase
MTSRITQSFSNLAINSTQTDGNQSKRDLFSEINAETSVPQNNPQGIKVEQLLELKLKNPDLKLSADESIALLTHCMTLGDQEAQKAINNELIVVIGNTGAGKSTFVNYLYGCKMKRIKPQDIGMKSLHNKIVVVKNKSDGGPIDEIMPIGHTKKSMTFMPQMATEHGLTFCDCPGFLDNRGIEINIANAVNIKNAFTKANRIKVIMLINYYSLGAEKARGLADMIKISCDLFGSRENLIKNKDSILLGITQVPLAEVQDEEDDNNQDPLEKLKEFISDTETLRILADNLFIYDPLDNVNLKYSGALKRNTILNEVNSMKAIEDPAKIFRTVLTDKDEIGLIKITDEIKDKIENVFAEKNLSIQDFKKIAIYLDSLYKLEVIDHTHVTKLVAKMKNVVVNKFKAMMSEFTTTYLDTSTNISQQSNEMLEKIKAGAQYFNAHIQNDINLAELEKRYALYVKKFKAKEVAKGHLDIERKFRNYCLTTNFRDAEELLNQMEKEVKKFNEEFYDTGIATEINIQELRTVYNQAKSQYDNAQRRKQDDEEKYKNLKKETDRLKKQARRADNNNNNNNNNNRHVTRSDTGNFQGIKDVNLSEAKAVFGAKVEKYFYLVKGRGVILISGIRKSKKGNVVVELPYGEITLSCTSYEEMKGEFNLYKIHVDNSIFFLMEKVERQEDFIEEEEVIEEEEDINEEEEVIEEEDEYIPQFGYETKKVRDENQENLEIAQGAFGKKVKNYFHTSLNGKNIITIQGIRKSKKGNVVVEMPYGGVTLPCTEYEKLRNGRYEIYIDRCPFILLLENSD